MQSNYTLNILKNNLHLVVVILLGLGVFSIGVLSFSYNFKPRVAGVQTENTSIANDDVVFGEANTDLDISVFANDITTSETEFELVIPPVDGDLLFKAVTQEVIYTAEEDYTGSDNFTYKLCEAGNEGESTQPVCDDANVEINISEEKLSPTATDDYVITSPNKEVEIHIFENDKDLDGVINTNSFTILELPIFGSVEFDSSKQSITYVPENNYSGEDKIKYTICDDDELCDSAYVFVTISSLNLPPSANDDIAFNSINLPINLFPLENDSDPDGQIDSESFALIEYPSHGTFSFDYITLLAKYVPNWNYEGSDSITYQICDNEIACDKATITLTLVGKNVPPVANDDVATTDENSPVETNIFSNDYDPDGEIDLGSMNIIYSPENGTLSSGTKDQMIYTPNFNFTGGDSFVYEVCDFLGLCDRADVQILVYPENLSKKVTICHRTNALTNPYVVVTVSQNAVDGDDSPPLDDHKVHIIDAQHDWKDIIPITDLTEDGLINEEDCIYEVLSTNTWPPGYPTPTPKPILTPTNTVTPLPTNAPVETIVPTETPIITSSATITGTITATPSITDESPREVQRTRDHGITDAPEEIVLVNDQVTPFLTVSPTELAESIFQPIMVNKKIELKELSIDRSYIDRVTNTSGEQEVNIENEIVFNPNTKDTAIGLSLTTGGATLTTGGLLLLLAGGSNPVGLMLSGHGLTAEERIKFAKKLGARYYKPKNIFLDKWTND